MAKNNSTEPAATGNKRQQRIAEQQAAAEKAARKRLYLVVGIVAAVTVIAIGLGVFFASQPKKVAPGSDPWGARKPEMGKPLLMGNPDAKVKVRLYEDALCSHCLDFERDFGAQLTKMATDNKISYAVYPLAFQGQPSATAASALACSSELGFLSTMHAAVFTQAQQWDAVKLTEKAKEVAPDRADDLRRCVTTKRYDSWVNELTKKASENDKITGTPALFINDKQIPNGSIKTEAELNKLIDEANK